MLIENVRYYFLDSDVDLRKTLKFFTSWFYNVLLWEFSDNLDESFDVCACEADRHTKVGRYTDLWNSSLSFSKSYCRNKLIFNSTVFQFTGIVDIVILNNIKRYSNDVRLIPQISVTASLISWPGIISNSILKFFISSLQGVQLCGPCGMTNGAPDVSFWLTL